jgi:23S rRNA G2069 N7-methylase RlmK/C1962 C5-methylase RlmI
LPGLIADRYSDFLICQFLSAGAEYWKRTIVEQFGRIVAVQGICERSRGEAHSNSCSGLASENLFHQVVAAAALDSDRQVRIIERLGQAADHPVTAVFPQGHYLKGLIGMVST